MFEIKYEIVKKIGVLSSPLRPLDTSPKYPTDTMSKPDLREEVQPDQLNDREPKYDIRDWSADHEKMGKILSLRIESSFLIV